VTKMLQLFSLVLAFALSTAALASAQDQEKEKEKDKDKAPSAQVPTMIPQGTGTPLKVQIAIGRYQGEKKVASMPYTLTMSSMRPWNHASLRMGAKIPIVMLSIMNMPKDAPQGGPIQYQDVGTNIDCFADPLGDGRYWINVSVEDSSVYPDDQPAGSSKGSPSFRTFRATNALALRNGETGQFTAATDKVNGETVRVDVTLTVVK
jgi:hypothetical protein